MAVAFPERVEAPRVFPVTPVKHVREESPEGFLRVSDGSPWATLFRRLLRGRLSPPLFIGVSVPAPAPLSSTSPNSPAALPLSYYARVMALTRAAQKPWRANHCRVAARLSHFLLIAASLCFLLLPVSLCALALKPASYVGARLARASRGEQKGLRVPGLDDFVWFRPVGPVNTCDFVCRP